RNASSTTWPKSFRHWYGRRCLATPRPRSYTRHMSERADRAVNRNHLPEQYVERPAARQGEPPNCPGMRQRSFAIGATAWTACEDTQHGALIFYGPGIARRVGTFPPNWYELSDIDLY